MRCCALFVRRRRALPHFFFCFSLSLSHCWSIIPWLFSIQMVSDDDRWLLSVVFTNWPDLHLLLSRRRRRRHHYHHLLFLHILNLTAGSVCVCVCVHVWCVCSTFSFFRIFFDCHTGQTTTIDSELTDLLFLNQFRRIKSIQPQPTPTHTNAHVF